MKMFIFINGTFAADWLEILLNVTRSFLKKNNKTRFLVYFGKLLKENLFTGRSRNHT